MKIKNIDKLDGREFEDLIEKLIKQMGFVTEERKYTSDGGIDIIAINEIPIVKGKYIIQCKRYSKPIGEPILRDLYGVVNSEHANKGILITNSTFTQAAKRFAKNKPLELIGGRQLVELLDKYLKYSSKKKSKSELKISEVYRVTQENLDSALQKINERRNKIKQGLIFVGSKSFKSSVKYGQFTQGKLNKLARLSKVYFNQFNHLNEIWRPASEVRDTYIHIRQVKLFCKELVETLKTIEKEWEGLMKVQPPLHYEECHSILCSMCDPFFSSTSEVVQQLADILKKPDDYMKGEDTEIRLAFTVNIEKEGEEFARALKEAVKKEKGSCFIATVVYGNPFSPEVCLLYEWRDKVLKKSFFGKIFVALYYTISPKVVIIVEKISVLRKAIRKLLNLFIRLLKRQSIS